MQQVAEDCLEGKVGAIVALGSPIRQDSGHGLFPSFSQEAFERGLLSQEWQRLSQDKNHPLENRALQDSIPQVPLLKLLWRWPPWKSRSSPRKPS